MVPERKNYFAGSRIKLNSSFQNPPPARAVLLVHVTCELAKQACFHWEFYYHLLRNCFVMIWTRGWYVFLELCKSHSSQPEAAAVPPLGASRWPLLGPSPFVSSCLRFFLSLTPAPHFPSTPFPPLNLPWVSSILGSFTLFFLRILGEFINLYCTLAAHKYFIWIFNFLTSLSYTFHSWPKGYPS